MNKPDDTGEERFALPIGRFYRRLPNDISDNISIDAPVWSLLDLLETLLSTQNHEHFRTGDPERLPRIQNSIIHPDSKIDPFAIVNDSYIGPEVTIGPFTCVSRSMLLPGSKVARHAYVCRSVIGSDTILCGNVRIATRRVDLKNPAIKEIGVIAPTQRIGSFIGENVFVASSVTLMPLTCILPNTKVLPFRSIKGLIGDD